VPRRRKEINPKSKQPAEQFALRLRAVLEARGWTSRELAARLTQAGLPIGPRGIDSWLRARTAPAVKDLPTLCRVFGVGYDELLPPLNRQPVENRPARG
jgi:transcriptional regulator with XRE-family HTH domain